MHSIKAYILFIVLVALSVYPRLVHACSVMVGMDLRDLLYADAIVEGRVINYEIIDVGDVGPLPNYAVFTFIVDETIYGEYPNENGNFIRFTWDNSTFGEPADWDRSGSIVVGLRNSTSEIPPLRGPSATILRAPEQNVMTVLQAPCSLPFIFRDDDIIRAVKQIFDGEGNQQAEMDVFAEYFLMNGGSGQY